MAHQMSVLAIDIAKLVFHVVGMDDTGVVVLRKRIARSELLTFIASLPPVIRKNLNNDTFPESNAGYYYLEGISPGWYTLSCETLSRSASNVATSVSPIVRINATVTESLVINPSCTRMASLALTRADVRGRTRIPIRGICWTDRLYSCKFLMIAGRSFSLRAGWPPVINPLCKASSTISRCVTSNRMCTPVKASTCLASHRWRNTRHSTDIPAKW